MPEFTEGYRRVEGHAPNGFSLVPGFLSQSEHDALLSWIDRYGIWHEESGGCRRAEFTDLDLGGVRHGPYPEWGAELSSRLLRLGAIQEHPNHIYLFEYRPPAGLAAHIDSGIYGKSVASVTLGSTCVFELGRAAGKSEARVLLVPGDLYLLTGPARFEYHHWIGEAMSDRFGDVEYPRDRRIALTFRTLLRRGVSPGQMINLLMGRDALADPPA